MVQEELYCIVEFAIVGTNLLTIFYSGRNDISWVFPLDMVAWNVPCLVKYFESLGSRVQVINQARREINLAKQKGALFGSTQIFYQTSQ